MSMSEFLPAWLKDVKNWAQKVKLSTQGHVSGSCCTQGWNLNSSNIFLYSPIWSLLSLYVSSYARAAFQSFVVQWKYQTHECKKERDYVMVHGLPDSNRIKSCPLLQCFTGIFTSKPQKFLKIVCGKSLYLVYNANGHWIKSNWKSQPRGARLSYWCSLGMGRTN